MGIWFENENDENNRLNLQSLFDISIRISQSIWRRSIKIKIQMSELMPISNRLTKCDPIAQRNKCAEYCIGTVYAPRNSQ